MIRENLKAVRYSSVTSSHLEQNARKYIFRGNSAVAKEIDFRWSNDVYREVHGKVKGM